MARVQGLLYRQKMLIPVNFMVARDTWAFFCVVLPKLGSGSIS